MTIKLIRDRVPVDDGGREVGVATGDERIARLLDKLHEEASEVAEAWREGDAELVVELADCLEVLHALAETTGIGWSAIRNARGQALGAWRLHPGPALRGAVMATEPVDTPPSPPTRP